MNKSIARVTLGLPVEGPFDYSIQKTLRNKVSLGQRVRVSFGTKNRIGYIVGLKARSDVKKLKPILSLIDTVPILDKNLLNLTSRFAEHYGCSWGEAIETSLPVALRGDKRIALDFKKKERIPSKPAKAKPEMILLHDETMDQKWPYLLKRIKGEVQKGRGVIFLVPEVALIEGICAKLKQYLNEPVVVLDKKLTAKKELEHWRMIHAAAAKIVIGTRSAIFAAVKSLGLIIIYDEENTAYKQEQSPFYHAHDVAFLRAKFDKCSLVFVSGAPSAELWWAATKKKINLVSFTNDDAAQVKLIDMSNYKTRRSRITFPLQNAMYRTLDERGKIILFMNRRGFSTVTHCHQCKETLKCKRCDVPLTYMYSKKKMVCRLCNKKEKMPKVCPHCKSSFLRSSGMGLEKLESEVARLFPHARVAHYDKETKTLPSNFDILIATQAVLKLQGQTTVSLIGVINSDTELNRVDFRSAQKTFSLLMRLKHLAKGQLIVQTRLMDNYCLKAAAKGDFKKFYREELRARKELGLPPFRQLVTIGLRGFKEDIVFNEANLLYDELQKQKSKNVEVLEPHPAITPKMRDKYRFTIMVTGQSIKALMKLIKLALKNFKRKRVIITVNPDFSGQW